MNYDNMECCNSIFFEQIACEWQKCMQGTVFLEDLDCTDEKKPKRRRKNGGNASKGFWYL